jgi:hypothetical protein
MLTMPVRKTTKAISEAGKEVGLEVNAEKTKYLFMFHHQNVGENHNLMIANKFFENTVKSKLSLGNACYHSVQNLLSSHLSTGFQD